MPLNLEKNFEQPDDFYQTLIDAHRDLSDAQSQSMNAQLVLLLANHIGDMAVIEQALALARANALNLDAQ
ncbi:hypothetical protein PATSB16_07430 [Pandoraea thiooxydans]|uniref:DNA topoisomerase IV n=1 Tax=Pandoraea thiooxydans TaxID=445709 RepID=A0A0G3EP83_9BURK|nr:DUF2783 domain-containing protein [Pandoraea thiooxydans]AKJ67127.1 hypothetical protein ABW99_01680 [Pandoraea thiooxydans]APR94085.1 hypothetical protein PATSB16_07430 [Pandoraea thiooxydans]